MTLGPDGALWSLGAVSACQYQVGRTTVSGISTSFSGLTPFCTGALDITSGPDGALWYTLSAGKIGRITISGSITEYPVPATPYGIASGSDGNLWFADTSGNKIWQVILGASGNQPISHVLPLPAVENSPNFLIQWAPSAGRLVSAWSIYVSDNGGPSTLWLNSVGSVTQAYYSGKIGHSYGFFSRATDSGTGIAEPLKTIADASTAVNAQIAGDVNGDGTIDCSDLGIVKASIGKTSMQLGFNPLADINHDGVIDIRDIALVSQKLAPGTRCP